MTKIVCFNVKYSANLGDGLIAECLEMALKSVRPDADVCTLDLAGRTGYGQRTVRARAIALALLDAMPPFLRAKIVRKKLERSLSSLFPKWKEALQGADLAIIGGGNLFQDADLNFPMKIAAALKCCRACDVPVAIHSVGVTPNWSEAARELFLSIEENRVTGISVRDAESRIAWTAEDVLPAVPVEIVRDPGLLAASILQHELGNPPKPAENPKIGICVTHPAVLRHHATGSTMVPGSRKFYRDLMRRCIARGWNVLLFTNGADEDHKHLNTIASGGQMDDLVRSGRVALPDRPECPIDMLKIIDSVDAVIAHRLHACIAAFALGRPHVGLDWDVKVASFFRSVDRSRFLIEHSDAESDEIVRRLDLAMRTGLPADRRQEIVDEARRDIARIADWGFSPVQEFHGVTNRGAEPSPTNSFGDTTNLAGAET